MIALFFFFFFKHKTAYEMRISDWSSDVCSSDLHCSHHVSLRGETLRVRRQNTSSLAPKRDSLRSVGECQATTSVFSLVYSEDECSASEKAREIGRASCRARVCQYV